MINIKKFLGLEFYTSPIDIFLGKLRNINRKLTASEQAEKDKYARIIKLRDSVNEPAAPNKLWDKF